MKIQPGIIVYRHPRYDIFGPNNLQHYYKPIKSVSRSLLRKRKHFTESNPNQKRIKDVSTSSFSYKTQINRYSLQFILNTISFKRISFTYNNIQTPSPEGRSTYPLLRKIFKNNKKITSARAHLVLFGTDKGVYYILEPLSLLRYLNYLELKIDVDRDSCIEAPLNSLISLYTKQKWPYLKSQKLIFNLTFNNTNSIQRFVASSSILRKIANYKCTELSFTFYFNLQVETSLLENLASSLKNLSNLISLNLRSSYNVNLYPIFLHVNQSSLRQLILGIKGDTLKNLSEILIERALSFSYLDICLVDSVHYQEIFTFISQLKAFSNLKTLKLSFWWIEEWNDQVLTALAESLSTLENLDDVYLELREHQQKSDITGLGIRSLFENLKYLTQLKHLSLNLGGCNHYIDDDTIPYLFSSLGYLRDLKNLSLNLKYNAIGDSGIQSLQTVIPKLEKLDVFHLDLEGCEWLCTKRLTKLAQSLSCLSFLSRLSLQFMCFSIEQPVCEAFVFMIQRLKSLSYLKLILCQPSGKQAVGEGLLSDVCGKKSKEIECCFRIFNSLREDDFSFYHGLYINKNTFF